MRTGLIGIVTDYTKGPWQIDAEDNSAGQTRFFIYRVNHGNEPAIALVYGPENAPLIGAAPELLESLKQMVDDMISHAKFGMNDKERAMLNRALDAISKAEGKII